MINISYKLILLSLLSTSPTYAYPSGSPVCDVVGSGFIDAHGSETPDAGFSITVQEQSAGQYNIVVSKQKNPIHGVLIYVIGANGTGDGTHLGTFAPKDGFKYVKHCTGNAESTITHSNGEEKSDTTFKWTAPADTKVFEVKAIVAAQRTPWQSVSVVFGVSGMVLPPQIVNNTVDPLQTDDNQATTTTNEPTTVKTDPVECLPDSPQCCWIRRIYELMGKTTSVSATNSTACCEYLGYDRQDSGIPGVYCNGQGEVYELYWRSYNLVEVGMTGPIPAEIGILESLKKINIHDNKVSGTIPHEIGNLKNLEELDNKLTGSIPESIGKLVNLKKLLLGGNQLNGSIPLSIGNLGNLKVLRLYDNQLSGSIPLSIGNLGNLEELLYDNNLTGSIPPEYIGKLVSLEILWLFNNQFNGPIPLSIGNLVNLTELSLHNNQLSGSIPPSLGNLTNLHVVYLQKNTLTGCIQKPRHLIEYAPASVICKNLD